MQRKAQVTMFIILGMIILAGFGFYLYAKSSAETGEAIKIEPVDFSEIEVYIDTCLERAVKTGIWQIGKNGGYANSIPPAAGIDNIPIYYDGTNDDIPALEEDIAGSFALEIRERMTNCLNFDTFTARGYTSRVPVPATLMPLPSFNNEDVTVDLPYDAEISKADSTKKFELFTSKVPVSFKQIYDKVVLFVDNVQDPAKITTPPAGDQYYDITQDCSSYKFENGESIKVTVSGNIIKFEDSSTPNKFAYQFAITSPKIQGQCP